MLPFACALAFWPMVFSAILVMVTESVAGGFFILALIGPLAAALTWWGLSELPRTAPVAADIRATDTGPALALPVARPSSAGRLVCVTYGVVVLGAGLWHFIASLNDDWSMGAAYFFMISLPALVALLIGFGIYQPPRKTLGNVGIVLTPQDIAIDYGKGPTSVAWQDVTAVGAQSRKEFRFGSGTNVITLVTGDADTGYRTIDIEHTDLETDPTRLYHLFVFYVRNPGRRGELGTELGLDRFLRAGYVGEYPTPATL
ncbi:hypothetical protein ACFWPK_00125 [Nocardia sp. NPDC058519]|uniref:hypothetical protein n=1 Tax=Nocardia sp. NPDC058519 TaxID=3346535 RepID=UPI00365E0B6D